MSAIIKNKSFKQPKTFYFSIMTSLWERLGYFMLAFIMTLFLQAVYQLSDTNAFSVFAVFTALSYITPVLGGYLSDNYLGAKRCMALGLFIELAGFVILSLPIKSYFLVALALSFVLLGTGFFKTGPANLLGRSYAKDDPRIDAGFTLYYMGINIGGFLSSFLAGTHKLWGWHAPFILSALGILFAIIWFFCYKHNAYECDVDIARKPLPLKKWFFIFLGTIICLGISIFLLQHLLFSRIFFYSSTIALLGYFAYQICISPKKEKLAILTTIILMFMAMFFFILYFQMFTSMIFYINRCVDRVIFGVHLPAVFFTSLDPVFIFALSPLYAMIYKALSRHNKDLSVTTKFPLGLLLSALCFLALYASTFFILPNNKISLLWMFLAYFLLAAGELLTSALGVAMITKIAPSRLYGIMMGAWYLLGAAFGADLSGSVASFTSIPQNLLNNTHAVFNIYASGFLKMSIIGATVAIIGFLISPWLKRMTQLNS